MLITSLNEQEIIAPFFSRYLTTFMYYIPCFAFTVEKNKQQYVSVRRGRLNDECLDIPSDIAIGFRVGWVNGM